MQLAMFPRWAIGWSGTPQAQSLIDDEPPNWIASRGSMHQAPSHAGDGAVEAKLAVV
jgi:hypothetical protein